MWEERGLAYLGDWIGDGVGGHEACEEGDEVVDLHGGRISKLKSWVGDIHDEEREKASTSNSTIEYSRTHPNPLNNNAAYARVKSVARRGNLTTLRTRKGHNLKAITQCYGEDRKT